MFTQEQILKRFTEEMQKDFYTDPMLYQVVRSLEAGVDPYLLIGDILQAYKKLADENTNLVMNGPQPHYIVVTEERYNKIKETGKL